MNREEAAQYFARKRDTLIWGLKDNRDETRQAHDAYNEAIDALCGPRPDPITGLVPCGCGGKAILFHQPDIEGPGSDGDRWAVFCEKTCGMETSDLTSREYAVKVWNTAMGRNGGVTPHVHNINDDTNSGNAQRTGPAIY